jgi:O-succinylbenzoate synthase
MRIARADLYELTLPLVEPFVISGGAIAERRSLIVLLHDDAGHVGYGESPPFHLPFYSEETLVGARDLIERVLLPRVVGRDCDLPEGVDGLLKEGIRGNWFARAGVETAAWDLAAHVRGTGLAALLGERLGLTPAGAVECGVALGIPPERKADALTRWVYEAVQRGYRRVKIKVAPGWDAAAVSAARAGLAGSDLPLTVDANGAYEWPRDEAALRGLDEAGLLYIEQPLAPDELVGHVRLGETLRTPVCLDETLRDARAARQIMALGGPKIWNIKVHRVGGLSEVCRLAVGRHDARIGDRVTGGARRGRSPPLRLSIRLGAVVAMVRTQHRRDQARDGQGRPHGGAAAVLRAAARPGAVPDGGAAGLFRVINSGIGLDPACSFGAP